VRVLPTGAPFSIPATKPVLTARPFSLPPPDRIAAVAAKMCAPPANAAWARAGRLSRADLTVAFERPAPGGFARFNVEDAGGYEGRRKCNLFALELAHRAGFAVPLVARARGIGFPGADRMAREASRAGEPSFARVADHLGPREVSDARARGGCFLLVASAPGRRVGHVAVIDDLLEVERGPRGALRRVRWTGWEATFRGARYGAGTFSLQSLGGRFDRMHLLALRPADEGPKAPSGALSASRLDRRPV
jgi:hypothetical protein